MTLGFDAGIIHMLLLELAVFTDTLVSLFKSLLLQIGFPYLPCFSLHVPLLLFSSQFGDPLLLFSPQVGLPLIPLPDQADLPCSLLTTARLTTVALR